MKNSQKIQILQKKKTNFNQDKHDKLKKLKNNSNKN